jgi:hypothetical protein
MPRRLTATTVVLFVMTVPSSGVFQVAKLSGGLASWHLGPSKVLRNTPAAIVAEHHLGEGHNKKAIVTVIAFSALCGSATAQNAITDDPLTAGTLYSACLASDATKSNDGLCDIYFRGLTDGLFVMEQMNLVGQRTCMPEKEAIGAVDARRMFNRHMTAHPEDAGHSAGLIAAVAVIRSFPCRGSD